MSKLSNLTLNTRINNIPTPEESYNALFGIDTSGTRVVRLKLCDLEFAPQKTPLNSEEELNEMAESIKKIGVKEPILVRKMPADGTHLYEYYQILNGRNRTQASKIAGMEDIPAIIEDVNDAEAQYIIATTTLSQRQHLKTSVKAWAYRSQMDAMKLMSGTRTDLVPSGHKVVDDGYSNLVPSGHKVVDGGHSDLVPSGHKVDTISIIAGSSNDSRRNIARYIRLTYLIEELLEMVDNDKLPMKSGVALSYLSTDEQYTVHAYITENQKVVSVEQADAIKRYSQEFGQVNTIQLKRLFNEEKKNASPPNVFKLNKKALSSIEQYIPATQKDNASDYIIKALEFYRKHQQGD